VITVRGRAKTFELGLPNERQTLELISLICRNAQRMHTQQVADCSYEWSQAPAYQKRMEETSARIDTLAAELAEMHPGYILSTRGDPRGYCVYILPPDGRSPDWGGAGVGMSADAA
jgi:hypothetical protein